MLAGKAQVIPIADLGKQVVVAEVYSPPRMCEMAEKLNMKGGFSLDLTTKDENGQAWDLSQQHFRTKALKLLEEVKPMLLVVCPPCTMFSTMQNVNIAKMDETDVKMRTEAAVSYFASSDDQGEAPARKRTKVATNSKAIAAALERYQCDGLHRHVTLENGRAKACEKYPDKFCRVVLEAFKAEMAAEQVDEFREPVGRPCRASCGCMGQCDEK